MSDNKKKKKPKTIYIDDGRTIADMSDITGGLKSSNSQLSNSQLPPLSGNTLKDKMQTYFNAMKMMFLPMLATMGVITVAFLILYLILALAS